MKLTEEQVQAIIDDVVSKIEAIKEDPCDGDYSDLECYEDELGRPYNFGSHSYETELEEVCIDGLPGIDSDESDIYITATCYVDMLFHDDYDPGDYWTPPSGGIEIDEVNASVSKIEIEISVLNHETDEYEDIEITEEQKVEIVNKVNEQVCPSSKKVVA